MNETNYLGLPIQSTAAQGTMAAGWGDSTYIQPNYYQWQYPWYPQYYPVYQYYPITINTQPDPRIEQLEKRVNELERKLSERGETKE